MRKNYVLIAGLLLMLWFSSTAQTTVNQVIICSGGNYSNPDDYVTIASYKPATGQTTTFGTIYTQSVQDVYVDSNYAYVAAQDSIAKFNIDTYERVASVEAVGVKRLSIKDNTLYATFQFPITEDFFRLYSAVDLSPIANIEGISDETSGILIRNNTAIVAVPGNWATPNGKIAWINLNTNTLLAEFDLGEWGKGINDFIFQLPGIYSFVSTPYGGAECGIYISDLNGNSIGYHTYDAVLANLTGYDGYEVYAEINGGIGVFDIENMELANDNLIAAPEHTLVASVLDTINDLIYFTTTDYLVMGEGFIYSIGGEMLGSFDAGISAEAIAIDYRNVTSVSENNSFRFETHIYPNPIKSILHIESESPIEEISILNLLNQKVNSWKVDRNSYQTIELSELSKGVYLLQLNSIEGTVSRKIIKE